MLFCYRIRLPYRAACSRYLIGCKTYAYAYAYARKPEPKPGWFWFPCCRVRIRIYLLSWMPFAT